MVPRSSLFNVTPYSPRCSKVSRDTVRYSFTGWKNSNSQPTRKLTAGNPWRTLAPVFSWTPAGNSIYPKHSNVVWKRIYLGRDGAECRTKWWIRTLLSAPRGCLQRGDERYCDAVNCYAKERKRRMAIQFQNEPLHSWEPEQEVVINYQLKEPRTFYL